MAESKKRCVKWGFLEKRLKFSKANGRKTILVFWGELYDICYVRSARML